MTDEEVLREIRVAFEYSYLHEEWVTPLAELLDGIEIEEALWRPSPESKNVWEIVLHTTVWTENIVRRVESGQAVRPGGGAWPEIPSPPSPEAWALARDRLWGALDLLRAFLEGTSLAEIQSGPYGLADLLCRLTHLGYHLGQMTKLRECFAAYGAKF